MGDGITGKGFSFVRTTFKDMQERYSYLWEKNFAETGVGEYCISERYSKLHETGHSMVIGIMLGETMVGYTSLLADEDLHTSESTAYCDAIYILPEYRSYLLFKSFIGYIESQLTLYKIKGFYISSSFKRDIKAILKRLGYSPVTTLFRKDL